MIDFAKKNKIPFESVSKLETTHYSLQTIDADVGVVAYFGTFIKSDILNKFRLGLLGIHPSLLPKYRGPTPVQTAILNGDKETGITIFKMDEKLDHGPILASEEFEISDEETTHGLHTALFKLGANLLEKTLIDYIEEVLKPVPQDEKEATFTKKLAKQDGFVDINKPPSKQKLDRMIRAYFPWPTVWTKSIINHQSLIIKFLPQQKIQVEGKNPQSFKDFINGYKEGRSLLKKLQLI